MDDASVVTLFNVEESDHSCGNRLMSSLLMSSQSNAGVCKLQGCWKPCFAGKDFCGRTHALQQIHLHARSVKRAAPPCGLPGCKRPAAVAWETLESGASFQQAEEKTYHEFCSWKHAKRGAALIINTSPVTASPVVEVPEEPRFSLKEFLPLGQIEALSRLLDALEHSFPKDANKNSMRQILASCGPVQFYKSHPWELLKDHQGEAPLYFYSFREASACKTERVTKEGLAWRQSSKPTIFGMVQKQSFSYKACISKSSEPSDLVRIFRAEDKLQQDTRKRKREIKWRYVMVEYSMTFQGRATLSSGSSEVRLLPVVHALRQRRDGFPNFPDISGQHEQSSGNSDLDYSFLDIPDDFLPLLDQELV